MCYNKDAEDVKHDYIVSGSQMLAETWTSGGVEHFLHYVYDESGSPIGLNYRTNAYAANVFDVFYFEKNLQGDIVAIYNDSGVRIGTYTYDAWGNFTVSTTSGITATERNIVRYYNPFRYRGYYYDIDIGMYYLQSRYYNPQWGRFLNADGYINANGDLIGYNMFAYCGNNPIMGCDPCGTCYHHWNFWEDCDLCAGKSFGERVLRFLDEGIDRFGDYITHEIPGLQFFECVHYARNIFNGDPPESLDGWKSSKDGGPKADCHQFTSPDKTNVKYVLGQREFIYDKYGNLVTDPRDVGTFNYIPSDSNGVWGIIGHAVVDVMPWIFYGNSPNDSTTIFDRIGSLIGGI